MSEQPKEHEPAAKTDLATDRLLATPERDARLVRDGTYLTNGVFLYRVVSAVVGDEDEIVLEDCYRLDIVQVRSGDLSAGRFRSVTPSTALSAPDM